MVLSFFNVKLKYRNGRSQWDYLITFSEVKSGQHLKRHKISNTSPCSVNVNIIEFKANFQRKRPILKSCTILAQLVCKKVFLSCLTQGATLSRCVYYYCLLTYFSILFTPFQFLLFLLP